MRSDLSDDQNAIARQWIRELLTQSTNQAELAKKLGVHQVTVSALANVKSARGTTSAVFIKAGRLLGIPHDEIARRLGLDVGMSSAQPYSASFLDACPSNLRRYLTAARTSLPPKVAVQLLRVFEVDRVDRDVQVWKVIAHTLEASADTPSEAAEEEPAAPPSSRNQWSGDEKHRSSRKVRVVGKR